MLQRYVWIAVAGSLLLGGCGAIYDDTKGWANRLEASILDTTEDDSAATEAPARDAAPARSMTESQEAAALTPIPRPEGTATPIRPDLADELLPDDGLLLEDLPSPIEPPPIKEARGDETPAADGETTSAAKLPPLPARKPEAEPKPDSDVVMVLHLSSLRSEEAAKREWGDLQRRFPEALGAMPVEISRTELGDKGTFYRVLAGPLPSKTAAAQACAAVKAKSARQYCRVLPPKPES